MVKDNSDGVGDELANLKDSEHDKSFVTKVRTRVSGLLNSSFSRIFGNSEEQKPTIRKRDDEDDTYSIHPPSKRPRLPNENNFVQNNIHNDFSITPSISTNNVNYLTQNSIRSFPEPVAGPSGLNLCKPTMNNLFTSSTISTRSSHNITNSSLLNGDKDSDSGESTSGYSSTIKAPNKKRLTKTGDDSEVNISSLDNSPFKSKTLFNSTSGRNTRSLFADRSVSPQANSSLSSRRPSFNTSTFGSPNFVDRTISTNKIINSPFYNGRTIYGGASAYSRRFSRSPTDLRKSVRNAVFVKPVNETTNESTNTMLSKTARRILDTLEQYTSTPVSDARKIPVPTRGEKQEGLLSKYIGANPYKNNRREPKVSSNRELLVPSVPELLQMKQRQCLQDTTESVRKIANSSKSILNTPKINPDKSDEYKLGQADSSKQKHKSKMKNKISSVRQKPEIEILENVVLNPVALPISTLPKFDLVIPPPDSMKSTSKSSDKKTKSVNTPKLSTVTESLSVVTEKKATKEKKHEKKIESDNVNNTKNNSTSAAEYTFSNPVIIASNLKSIIAINNFKFSEPLKEVAGGAERSDVKNLNEKENAKGSDKKKVNGEMLFKSGKDSLLEKFKPAEGTWECSTCLIRNKAQATRCEACQTSKSTPESSKPPTIKPQIQGFDLIKTDDWECSTCMLRNKPSQNTCPACTAPKPASSASKPSSAAASLQTSSKSTWKCDTCWIENKMEVSKCAACGEANPSGGQTKPAAVGGFGAAFKPSSDSWECDSCLVRNKGDAEKCVACQTSRTKKSTTMNSAQTSFGVEFKMSNKMWECDSCLVRNKNEDTKCVACGTMKPGSFGQSFQKKNDQWECPSCMVRNESKLNKCRCCGAENPDAKSTVNKNTVSLFNFGVNKTPFKFGVPEDQREKPKSSSESAASLVFGQSAKPLDKPATFSFGVKPVATPTVASPSETNAITQDAVKPATSVVVLPVIASTAASAINSPKPLFEFGATATEPPKLSAFGVKPPNGDSNKESGLFAVPNSVAATGPAGLSAAAVTSSPAAAPMFSFRGKSAGGLKRSAPVLPVQQDLAKKQAATPAFKFGASAAESKSFGIASASTPPKAVSTLFANASNATNPPTVATPTFAFGANAAAAKPNLSTEIKPFAFGGSTGSDQQVNKIPAFSFGQNSAVPVSQFGAAPMANEPAKPPMFSFGNPTANAEPAPPGTAGGFSFNSGSNSAPAPSAGGFSFGSTNKSETVVGINSGASQNPFGSAAPSAPKNGVFNFGSSNNNNNQKAGFSFGASQPQSNGSQSSGFNFSALGAPPSGAFNFDAGTKPTFNFTGGNVAGFSAQPNESIAGSRKIKRAVRRTQR